MKPGAKVALVTPARHASQEVVDAASAAVRSWGFDPVLHPDTNQPHGQFGGTDAQRAAALNAAFADPEIGAVWALRGGYGCTRLLPHLDAQTLRDNPTWIVGFSDVTALHGWANQAGVASLHAPVASTWASTDDDDGAALVEVLKTGEPTLDQLDRAVVGGNLSVLYAMLGTPHMPPLEGKWLLLEDVDEYLYHLDRMLVAFTQAGVWGQVAGVMVGSFTDMRDNTVAHGQSVDNPFGKTAEEILASHLGPGELSRGVGRARRSRGQKRPLHPGLKAADLRPGRSYLAGMFGSIKDQLTQELADIDAAGLYKRERVITSAQDAEITLDDGSKVLNFCANNYLGLSSHPRVVEAAKRAIDTHGFGMSSVRFICGTQDIHKELEQRIADFHHTEDTILYAAAFDANGGVFEPLLTKEDAIVSDSLNHASIIDGVRLCKAQRYRYANNDMEELEQRLKEARANGARHIVIVTDGVFSMDGYVAQIDKICDLADTYEAMVMVDECHATGFIGKTGRGSLELRNALGRVDIITGTLGKAMGGAMGGFTTGKREIIEMLRQRSRPYLFSNSLAPSIVGASIEVFKMLDETTELRDRLEANTAYFKEGLRKAGLPFKDGESAIVPVMLGDAKLSQVMANALLEEGIYVIGFFYPVVPKGEARIRVQLSAAHTQAHLDRALAAFEKVGRDLGVVA